MPSLADVYLDRVQKLLAVSGQDNGSVLCILTLVEEVFAPFLLPLPSLTIFQIVAAAPSSTVSLAQFCTKFLSALKKLSGGAGESTGEYDVGGVRDPFLQIALMRVLRLIATENDTTSMSEALGIVMGSTDGTTPAGRAVLLEAAQSILSLGERADHELRVVAVNVLGKFLTFSDPNIRYLTPVPFQLTFNSSTVALDFFDSLLKFDRDAVQRYRPSFIELLQDEDRSIRRKALMLLYTLVDADNVRTLVRELLKVLTDSEPELKQELALKIADVTEKCVNTVLFHPSSVMMSSGTHLLQCGT